VKRIISVVNPSKTGFGEVGSTGVFISETRANYVNAMLLLEKRGLRPLALREALIKIDHNAELKEVLKGKSFWLARQVVEGGEDGLIPYYTFDEMGNLLQWTPGNED
jgi:hypothetical protein